MRMGGNGNRHVGENGNEVLDWEWKRDGNGNGNGNGSNNSHSRTPLLWARDLLRDSNPRPTRFRKIVHLLMKISSPHNRS